MPLLNLTAAELTMEVGSSYVSTAPPGTNQDGEAMVYDWVCPRDETSVWYARYDGTYAKYDSQNGHVPGVLEFGYNINGAGRVILDSRTAPLMWTSAMTGKLGIVGDKIVLFGIKGRENWSHTWNGAYCYVWNTSGTLVDSFLHDQSDVETTSGFFNHDFWYNNWFNADYTYPRVGGYPAEWQEMSPGRITIMQVFSRHTLTPAPPPEEAWVWTVTADITTGQFSYDYVRADNTVPDGALSVSRDNQHFHTYGSDSLVLVAQLYYSAGEPPGPNSWYEVLKVGLNADGSINTGTSAMWELPTYYPGRGLWQPPIVPDKRRPPEQWPDNDRMSPTSGSDAQAINRGKVVGGVFTMFEDVFYVRPTWSYQISANPDSYKNHNVYFGLDYEGDVFDWRINQGMAGRLANYGNTSLALGINQNIDADGDKFTMLLQAKDQQFWAYGGQGGVDTTAVLDVQLDPVDNVWQTAVANNADAYYVAPHIDVTSRRIGAWDYHAVSMTVPRDDGGVITWANRKFLVRTPYTASPPSGSDIELSRIADSGWAGLPSISGTTPNTEGPKNPWTLYPGSAADSGWAGGHVEIRSYDGDIQPGTALTEGGAGQPMLYDPWKPGDDPAPPRFPPEEEPEVPLPDPTPPGTEPPRVPPGGFYCNRHLEDT